MAVAFVAGVPDAADAHRPSDYRWAALSEGFAYVAGARYYQGWERGSHELVEGTLGISWGGSSVGLRAMHGKLGTGARYGAPDGRVVTTDATIVSAWLGGATLWQVLPFLSAGLAMEWDLGWSHLASRDIEHRDQLWMRGGIGPVVDFLVSEHHSCQVLVVFTLGGIVPGFRDEQAEDRVGVAIGLSYLYSPTPHRRRKSLWGVLGPDAHATPGRS